MAPVSVAVVVEVEVELAVVEVVDVVVVAVEVEVEVEDESPPLRATSLDELRPNVDANYFVFVAVVHETARSRLDFSCSRGNFARNMSTRPAPVSDLLQKGSESFWRSSRGMMFPSSTTSASSDPSVRRVGAPIRQSNE
ncbi:hypothetical protein L484_010352 [Morus notabilis]|uniref:Uncharacterized protein n=1 Tax=Morus notabilis TaxID=981085 RepID=W9RNQ2_9ROSA|nr:hypothetical protein L484_010352 [Morus notabilis]